MEMRHVWTGHGACTISLHGPMQAKTTKGETDATREKRRNQQRHHHPTTSVHSSRGDAGSRYCHGDGNPECPTSNMRGDQPHAAGGGSTPPRSVRCRTSCRGSSDMRCFGPPRTGKQSLVDPEPNVDRTWPSSGQVWSISGRICSTLCRIPNSIGRTRPKFGRFYAKLADVGRNCIGCLGCRRSNVKELRVRTALKQPLPKVRRKSLRALSLPT